MLKVESASEVQSRDAEKGTGWGTRSPTPFAGQRRPTPALPVDAVSIATGGGRAGPESGSRGAASPAPAPAPNPRPGSPACGAGLAPVGVTASFSPSPRSPNHWDPEPASGSCSSWGSGGVAMAGGPARRSEGGLAGPRCGAWATGLSLLLSPPGLGARGSCGVSAAAAAATPAELLAAALPASAPPPPPPLPPGRAAARCLRSSSYSSRRRRFATSKPVITQVEMACFALVSLGPLQPPAC